MPRDHRLYLDDILEAIGNIRDYVVLQRSLNF